MKQLLPHEEEIAARDTLHVFRGMASGLQEEHSQRTENPLRTCTFTADFWGVTTQDFVKTPKSLAVTYLIFVSGRDASCLPSLSEGHAAQLRVGGKIIAITCCFGRPWKCPRPEDHMVHCRMVVPEIKTIRFQMDLRNWIGNLFGRVNLETITSSLHRNSRV